VHHFVLHRVRDTSASLHHDLDLLARLDAVGGRQAVDGAEAFVLVIGKSHTARQRFHRVVGAGGDDLEPQRCTASLSFRPIASGAVCESPRLCGHQIDERDERYGAQGRGDGMHRRT
jgi:hypothetical protein